MADADIVLARAEPFRLGTLRIGPATREVIGPGVHERLEPRVMQVLVALARAEGRILTREDLIETCWGGRIVGDDAINRVIARLRRVGEAAGGGAFRVETITKVGYRLLEEVSAGEDLASDAPARRPSRISRRGLLIGGGAAGMVAVAGAGFWIGSGTREEQLAPEARSLLDRGVEASRLGNAESTAQAVGFLQEAVRLAPDSAAAWGALALAHYAGQHFLDDQQALAARHRSQSAARRALELDPRSGAGLAALALAIPPYGRWLEAETALRRVIAVEPMQFEARLTHARLLANVGRTRAAVELLEPLAGRYPLQPVLQYVLAFLYWQAGRIDESDLILSRAMERWPRNYQVWFTRYWQLVHSGRARDALGMAAQTALRPIGIPDWNFALIELSARAILTRSAADREAALRANLDAARRGAGFAENAMEIAGQLGAADQAFEVADAYYFGRGFTVGPRRYSDQQGSYTRPTRRETKLLFSPSTANMRADRRFAGLVETVGLAGYWRRSGTRPDAPLAR